PHTPTLSLHDALPIYHGGIALAITVSTTAQSRAPLPHCRRRRTARHLPLRGTAGSTPPPRTRTPPHSDGGRTCPLLPAHHRPPTMPRASDHPFSTLNALVI